MGSTSPIDDTVNGTARTKDDDSSGSRYNFTNASSGMSARYMARIVHAYELLSMPRCKDNSYYKVMYNIVEKLVLPAKREAIRKAAAAGRDDTVVRLSRKEEISASFAAVYYVTVLKEGWWTTRTFLSKFRDKDEFNLARGTALKYRNAYTPDISWEKMVGRLVLDNTYLHVVCNHVDTIVTYMDAYMKNRTRNNAIECVVAGAIITLLKCNLKIPRVTTRHICEAADVNSSTAGDISEEMMSASNL